MIGWLRHRLRRAKPSARRANAPLPSGAGSPSPGPSRPATSPAPTRTPRLTEGDRVELRRLIERAWRFTTKPQGPFCLELRPEKPEETLKAIYAHAWRWAPGFDIPLSVPKLRFLPPGAGSSGAFAISEHGWTTIEACSSLKGRPDALARVLAHEACHHFLFHCGLADRVDTRRNERLTELAMFVCGLGEIAIDGETEMAQLGMRADPEQGYLGCAAMLAAQDEVTRRARELTTAKVASVVNESLEAEARRAFSDPGQLPRMVQGYARLHPGASRSEILTRMLEDYRRDRR